MKGERDMKRIGKIFFSALIGGAVGLLIPYIVALTNTVPFLRGETPYEQVLQYMFTSSLMGFVIGGIYSALRGTSDKAASK